jgi:hypothetical protein
MIKARANPGPAFVSGDDWKEASRGLYAIANNNEDHLLKFDLNSDSPEDIPVAPLIETSNRVVLGLDLGEMGSLKAIATYKTDHAAEQAARTLEEILVQANPALEKLEKSASLAKQKESEDFYRVARAILGACAVRQRARNVELQARKKLTANENLAIGPALLEWVP